MPGSLNASCDRDLVANLLEIERLFVGSVWVEEVEEVHVGLVVGRLVTELVQVQLNSNRLTSHVEVFFKKKGCFFTIAHSLFLTES